MSSITPPIQFQQSLDDRAVMCQYMAHLFTVTKALSTTRTDDERPKYLNVSIPTPSWSSSDCHVVLRSLSMDDIEQLEQNGCSCHDWSNIYFMVQCKDMGALSQTNHPSLRRAIKTQIRNCTFSGTVILGLNLLSGSDPTNDDLMQGIQYNTLISNSILEPGSKVFNNGIISNTFIGSNARVFQCGSISLESSSEEPCFHDEMMIHVGPEAGGGRRVQVHPETTLVEVCSALSLGTSHDKDSHGYVKENACVDMKMNVICGNVQFTKRAANVYICPGAKVESSPSVRNVILLPNASIVNSVADSVFLQWHASITHNSTVSNTILLECSDIGPNSVVASTILGPDSHLSCGEAHCSVIGPNTNAHHQSLLISALWPTGRGNVGYGSNIGSNHTGRLPDQECAVGEGIFWGLGSVIKYPVDLSRSFYSVIAAGVQLPPQSVAMPFSLIMSGNSRIGGDGMNEIVPGWLLHSSPYTILRSEEKYKTRRKAKRHDFYCGWTIVRPATVNACIRARELLRKTKNSIMSAGESSNSKAIFTEKDIVELGKNYMTIRGLNVGIHAYTQLIQRYALDGLLEVFRNGASLDDIKDSLFNYTDDSEANSWDKCDYNTWPILPWEEASHGSKDLESRHKLEVLSIELPHLVGDSLSELNITEICSICLKKLCDVETAHASQVLKCKKRDDQRGTQIIPGYIDAHVLAEEDPVVLLAQKRAEKVVQGCQMIMASLNNSASRL